MTNTLAALCLGGPLIAYLLLMFRVLPGERWQMLAALPLRKNSDGRWQGLNVTYYGLFTANAYAFGVMLVLVLAASIGVPFGASVTLIVVMLLICVPASRIVARIVEGRKHTITSGGAVFVGSMISPLVIHIVNLTIGPRAGFHIPIVPMLAAFACSYVLAEAMGRLACASFGCCYGRPITQVRGPLRPLFKHWHFVFNGQTKKAVYEGHHCNEPLVPIQEITALFLAASGTTAMFLYLNGYFYSAVFVAMGFAQAWRFVSEFIRNDYRGGGQLSSYQVMALILMASIVGLALVMGPAPVIDVSVMTGLRSLWAVPPLLLLQAVWVATFLFTGLSEVTSSHLSFQVVHTKLPKAVVAGSENPHA